MNTRRIRKALQHWRRLPEIGQCLLVFREPLRLFLVYSGLVGGRYPMLLETRTGKRLTLSTLEDLRTAWIVFCRKEYSIRADDRVVIDAGANIGVFSVYLLDRVPEARAVAIEPSPSTLDHLRRNLRANRLEERVTVRAAALSRHPEPLYIQTSRASQFRTTSRDAAHGVEVPGITIEKLLTEHGIQHVDLFKMDIEGSEYEVLASCSAKTFARIRRFVIEYHPCGKKSVLFDILAGQGFVLRADRVIGDNAGVAEFVSAGPGSTVSSQTA